MACALVLVSRMEYWTVSPQPIRPSPFWSTTSRELLVVYGMGAAVTVTVAEPELPLIGSV